MKKRKMIKMLKDYNKILDAASATPHEERNARKMVERFYKRYTDKEIQIMNQYLYGAIA